MEDRMLLYGYDTAVLCFCFPTQALVFPNQLYELVFEEELSTTSISVRLYGGALLSTSSTTTQIINTKKLFMLPHARLHYSGFTAAMHEGLHSQYCNDADTQCSKIYLYAG